MHCNLRPCDVAPVVVVCLWPNLYCACAGTAISELPVKILRAPFTIIFSDSDFLTDGDNLAIRRRFQALFSLYRSKMCHISISRLLSYDFKIAE